MDIRTIMFVHISFMLALTGIMAAIAVHPHFRQFHRPATAFAIATLSTLLRLADTHIPLLFSIVLANLLLQLTMLLLHRCLADFVRGGSRTKALEALIVTGELLGLLYYTFVEPSLNARVLVLHLSLLAIAALTILILLGCRDPAVRTPCRAVAVVYTLFSLAAIIRCLGVLFKNAPRDLFSSSTTTVLGLVGFQIMIVGFPLGYFWMTSARLWNSQNQLARTDDLTGLPNRRALEERSLRTIEQSRVHLTPLAVLALDIDHFKNLNDRYGHKGGDLALRSLAHTLAAAVRQRDLVARIGGEEFVILLWNSGLDTALATAERIRQTIEDLEIPLEVQETQESQGNQDAQAHQLLKTTVSGGLALLQPDDTLETALRRADHALYAAKLVGRNRILLDPALPATDRQPNPTPLVHSAPR